MVTFDPKLDWKNIPNFTTPITAEELIRIEQGIADVVGAVLDIVAAEGWVLASPVNWDANTEYTPRIIVDDDGGYFVSLVTTTGDKPTTSPTKWHPLPTAIDAEFRADANHPDTGFVRKPDADAAFDAVDAAQAAALRNTTSPRVRFRRGSAALLPETFTSQPAHQPRWHDGGLFIEQPTTNDLIHSEDLAQWEKSGTQVETGVTAPDGTTANRVRETPATGTHRIYQGGMSTTARCYSIWLKAAERSRCWLVSSNQHTQGALFDLISGTVVSTHSDVYASGIEPWPDGWFRCWVAFLADVSQSRLSLTLVNASNEVDYTGDINAGLYVWGAQCERSLWPTTYIKTTGSPSDRDGDALLVSGHHMSPDVGTVDCTFRVRGQEQSAGTAPSLATQQRRQLAWTFGFPALQNAEQVPRLFVYYNFDPVNVPAVEGLRLRMRNHPDDLGDDLLTLIELDDNPLLDSAKIRLRITWGGNPGASNWLRAWGSIDGSAMALWSESPRPNRWPSRWGVASMGPLHVGCWVDGKTWHLNGWVYDLALHTVKRTSAPHPTQKLPVDVHTSHMWDFSAESLEPV